MKNLLLIVVSILIISCTNSEKGGVEDAIKNDKNTSQTTTSQPNEQTSTPDQSEKSLPVKKVELKDLIGTYVGDFVAEVYDEDKQPSWMNKINITIDDIKADKIFGYSVVAGNKRPFSGSIQPFKDNSNHFVVNAKEPGDDKYDGKFNFTIMPEKKQLEGRWKANDKKLAVTERSYTMDKKAFKYDPQLTLEGADWNELYGTYNLKTGEAEFITEDVYSKNPSLEELTKKDVENLHKGDLEVMRNGIYARHGYSFKNRKMRYVFNFIDWYIPHSIDIRNDLTDLEKKNIELIKRYEKHAEKYYDSFGR